MRKQQLRVGRRRPLRVQWRFLNGRARRLGPFSTAGAGRLRAFVHYRSSHNRAKLVLSILSILSEVMDLERFHTAQVTSKLTNNSLVLMPFGRRRMISYLSSTVATSCILCCFRHLFTKKNWGSRDRDTLTMFN